MIQKERITWLNWEPPGEGRYVLYWMQAAQREEYNHALEYAVERANDLNKSVVVVFGLTAAFPEANERHYRFMLEGLRETRDALRGRGIQMAVRAESPVACIPEVADVNLEDLDRVMEDLKIDRSVGGVDSFRGGTRQAKRRLRAFVRGRLDEYPERRNDPNAEAVSGLSPYLHFGQISPLYVALQVRATSSRGKDPYLEELIVRRELSSNFVYYCHEYDSFESLPPWARRTLNYHSRDKREYVYSREDFEAARTHDPYWNAAQMEMVLTGKMHGYMRMYWGKKILEWTPSPQEGFKIALYLNNKYELDGRDPNGFAGVAWCFGKHDRAWQERPVFGEIRYMNGAGLKRKFDADAYAKKIAALAVG